MGLFYRVYLDCGFPLVSYVTTQSLENLDLGEGKTVAASIKATASPCHKKINSRARKGSLIIALPPRWGSRTRQFIEYYGIFLILDKKHLTGQIFIYMMLSSYY